MIGLLIGAYSFVCIKRRRKGIGIIFVNYEKKIVCHLFTVYLTHRIHNLLHIKANSLWVLVVNYEYDELYLVDACAPKKMYWYVISINKNENFVISSFWVLFILLHVKIHRCSLFLHYWYSDYILFTRHCWIV